MLKMLLTSTGFENPRIGSEFLKQMNKPADAIKILFIPTAAITDTQLYYVGKCMKELLKLGIVKENIIEYNMDSEINYSELSEIDAIYVCGGDKLHLLKKMMEAHFEVILKKSFEDGKMYIGTSAGSLVLGPKTKYSDGLNIINVIVYTHFCTEDKGLVEKYEREIGYKIIPLTDSQALLIINNELIIIE